MFNYLYDYISKYAPVLFFRIDTGGRIIEMNQHAESICGNLKPGMRIRDVIVDFNSSFDLDNLSNSLSSETLLTLITQSGFPQSYLFQFTVVDKEIVALGHLDYKDFEFSRTEILSLNQELGNLSRQLHKKNAELRYALDHVKRLQGIIPICMHCHKIRDERQLWEKLEAYLTENTDAMLSHSICPECMKKYYPELLGDDDSGSI